MDKKLIGTRIKDIRKKNKLTQSALANLLHTSQSTISSYENNQIIGLKTKESKENKKGKKKKKQFEDYLKNIEKQKNLINIYIINYILIAKLLDIIPRETWLMVLKKFLLRKN